MTTLSPHRFAAVAAIAARRAAAGLAITAIGIVTAAGLYTEAMRAPDQP
jgi:hypothetical protein